MLDFYDIYASLSPEQNIIWEIAQKFADEPELIEAIRQCVIKKEPFPQKYILKMGEIGFLGADIKEYGCAGIDSFGYGLIMQELERRNTALRSFVSVQGALVMHTILEYGSDSQKEKWLPLLRDGKAIGSFGLTESYGGSNPAALLTKAQETTEGFVINGSKQWITNGARADIAIIWARISPGPGGIRGFIVEKDTPGFTSASSKLEVLKASDTSNLFLQDCKIPKENLLPKTDSGVKAALSMLDHARYGIAWGVIGPAIFCYETALKFGETRKPFGEAINSCQLTQVKLSWMAKEITKAQLMCFQLARLREEKKITPEQLSMAKWNNVDIAIKTARLARGILAAAGLTSEYQILNYMLDLEAVKTYEGTEEIHKLIVGREITGISAF